MKLKKIFEFAQYKKINLLLLESRQPDDLEQFKSIVVIDKDCCEIALNVQ